MTDQVDHRGEEDDSALSPEELLDGLEPFEPYTTDELAERFDSRPRLISRLLDRLTRDERVRRKSVSSNPDIWIKEPPVNTCPACGREFEVKFLHPVFSSTQFCPRCGTKL